MFTQEERKKRQLEASKRWKERNPERVKASTKAWRSENKEAVADYNRTYGKEWRRLNPDRVQFLTNRWRSANKEANSDRKRAYHLKTKFNMTQTDYESMLKVQNFVCAICEMSYDKAYHVDHDHDTGDIRGLLCNSCNRGLGYFQDNPSIVANAATYLRIHKGIT